MIKLADILKEVIKADDAYRDEDAIQTVIDGRRNLGFIAVKASTMKEEDIWNTIKNGGLETVEVKGNAHDAYIYYRPGAKAEALELKAIAEKYGGYLLHNTPDEDSRRIGQLLGYNPADIEAYIEKNKHKKKYGA